MLDGLEWAALLAIVMVMVGGRKLPELGSGLGKGISEFKKAMGEATEQADSKPALEAEVSPADTTSHEPQ